MREGDSLKSGFVGGGEIPTAPIHP